ncbi:MAG: hypothetical protein K8J31_15955, partial [Anaerolineae bacterium]|nr:hypothetical protein [Anaerolineae bacterium]
LPLRFTWQGRTHTVIAHANHWRVVWGWWRWPVERDTFKVVTDTGLLVELAYDRLTGQWSLQRLYD